MIEKKLCFPGLRASSISQSLSYVCPLPECNPREGPYVCQCPAPLMVIGSGARVSETFSRSQDDWRKLYVVS